MPYILYKTDGTKLTTVDDANLDSTTDLNFVGRNYSGYGQVVNENFLKLLENFSSETAPAKPLKGQIWFDKVNGRLNVSYDGKAFKGIANIYVQPNTPLLTSLVKGDLWWDTDAFQLKAYDGNLFQVVGPFSPAAGRATWLPSEEETEPNTAATTPISVATIDDQRVAIVSKDSFTVQNIAISEKFPRIKRGITLSGADINGNSELDSILWGSTSHSLYSNTATLALNAVALLSGGTPSLLSSSSTSLVSYYNTATTSTTVWSIAQRDVNANLHANTFIGIATAARYADLAERYHADDVYEKGTVLVIGGEKEVTISTTPADTSVIGVVSSNPALMMNSEAGPDTTHPFIALKGRVPCKVVGPIDKGDLLVTSSIPGHAQAWKDGTNQHAVLGKALQDFNQDTGVIEILVI